MNQAVPLFETSSFQRALLYALHHAIGMPGCGEGGYVVTP